MPDGNIKLGVSLDVQNALQSAKQLQDTVKRAFDGKDMGNMDKEVQKVANDLTNASDQVNLYANSLKSLQATMQSLSAQAQSGESVAGSSRQYDALIDKVRAYEQELRTAQNALAENQKNISYNASVPSAIQVPTMSEAEIAQANQAIAEYEAKLQEVRATMSAMEANGTAFPKLSAEINQATASLNMATTGAMLLNEQFNAVGSSANFAQPVEQQASSVEQSMQTVTQAVQQGTASVQEVQKTGSNAVSNTGQTGTAIVASMNSALNRLETAVAQIENLINRADSSFSKLNSTAKKTGNSVASSFASTRKHVGSTSGLMSKLGKTMEQTFSAKGLKRGLTTILKYGFGVRSLYFLFRRLRNAVKEGLQNLVKYERAVGTSKLGKDANGVFQSTNQAITSLKTSLLYLKNAWAAAFAPIINAVMPMLTSLIDALATAGNFIARLVGVLTGQSKVLQAVKTSAGDYAESLDKSKKNADGASKAQKKLNDRLAQFDDLNVLGKDNDSGSGSGAGAGGSDFQVDPKNMFKYVKVDKGEFQWILDLIDDVKKKIEESGIVDAIKEFWEAVKKFKDSPLAQLLKEIALVLADHTFTSVLSTMTKAFRLLADILNGDLNKGLQDFKGLLANLTFDPLIAVAKVFDTIFKTDIAGWLEKVKKSVEDIDLSKLQGYENLTTALDGLKTAWNNLTTAVEEFWNKLKETGVADTIEKLIVSLVSSAFDTFLQGIATALSIISGILQTIADILKGDWGSVINDLKDLLLVMNVDQLITIASVIDRICGTNISGWLTDVKKAIQSLDIGAVLDNAKTKFDEFSTKVQAVFGAVVNTITEGWEKVKSAFWLAVGVIAAVLGITDEKFLAIKATIVGVLDIIRNAFVTAWDKIKSYVIASVTSVVTFIQNAWTTAKTVVLATLQTLADMIHKIWDKIADYIRTPVNAIVSGINTVIKGLEFMMNGIVKVLNAIKIDIPNWVPEWGGKTVGFNLKPVTLARVPKLAQGAVIPPNREFMAVLGDQPHGTNVEAPLDTIKQAVAEVMGNNGSAEMIQLLQQLITVVENKNLTIGDKEIGRANARYANQQRIIRGTSF